MEKKKLTNKERGRISLLSILTIASGIGMALSLIAYFGSDGFNLGALIVFMISLGVCAWSIIDASKMQKVIDARTYGVQLDPVGSFGSRLYCENCGARIESGVKFCSACGQKISVSPAPTATGSTNVSGRSCPRCSSHNITYQTVTEARKSGCGTVLLYVILALTVFGLLIVIPLMLRKKTETVTYAVCQNCGNRWRIN